MASASTNNIKKKHLTLVSMPWAIYNRPSIQLGCLKAFLEKNSDVLVRTSHPYIWVAEAVGIHDYHLISQRTWAGEAIYSALLYEKNIAGAEKLFTECTRSTRIEQDFTTLLAKTRDATERWLNSVDFQKSILVGFSVCFDQLLASLYAAKLIKSRYPGLAVVFGGSSCCGETGQSLLKSYSQIDYIVDGEGEQPLLDLVNDLHGKSKQKNHSPSRQTDSLEKSKNPQLQLQDSPPASYEGYFKEVAEHFPQRPFSISIPVEFSRGCWWGKCTFCNLNIGWHGYRWKSAEQLAGEVALHSKKYNVLDFTFTDNALPPKEADRFFEAVAEQPRDFSFFAEIRAVTSSERLQKYRAGGLYSVQIGIEALSDSLLEKMQKGVSSIENLAIMKFCLQHNIELEGNLITRFPTSTRQEVDETMEALDFAFPYHPLSRASFFLGAGSPVHRQPRDYGIVVVPHRHYKRLFPIEVAQKTHFILQDYRGDKIYQKKLWQPVENKIKNWQKFHATRSKSSKPALSYRDGGEFLLLRQERADKEVLRHMLRGTSRQIYLFCHLPRRKEEILSKFPTIPEESLLSFLRDLHTKRILYFSGNSALALAIHDSTKK